ncbi:hypothetical protein PybrP1_006499 [[Pythium] brassicae (nom. inval.)]|nr:hypothetical protein PybrP1_006499 [[Pythium] brassicae (nom. inval.)]
MATLKKALKAHKLFVAEVERCRRLEREGEQVLSSLGNVAQRLPLLLAGGEDSPLVPTVADADEDGVMGVLRFCGNAQTLLLQKHFGALEKGMAFLRDIVREFADVLRRMRSYVAEHWELHDELEPAGSGDRSVLVLAQQLEWMENVLVMYERELRRKRLLVADVEYHDAAQLVRRHAHWSARSAQSCVDHRYVQAGLEPPPPIPKPTEPVSEGAGVSSSSAFKSQAKKKKKRR